MLQQSYNSPQAGGAQEIGSRPVGATTGNWSNQLGPLPVSGSLATGATGVLRVALVSPAFMIERLSFEMTLQLSPLPAAQPTPLSNPWKVTTPGSSTAPATSTASPQASATTFSTSTQHPQMTLFCLVKVQTLRTTLATSPD